ncbi:hypothetical protein QBC37DRAFT_370237 [Rhypophila decipiens]|uniref:F-box domain-containing protein n=1 Tax=Rhypophila decipiens TaxID=261697 RepID=A0AAN7BBJ3_9PEZI|nr:hypothetical protein QBC37DRAFT_370237 [Rhypophila decipiens]
MSTLENTFQSVEGGALNPTRENTPTRFLSLPSEIRNMIYELVVVCPVNILPKLPGYNYELTPALLRTNKVIHAEASSLLYGQNCFEFIPSEYKHDVTEIVSFFDQIGTKNAGHIRRILIDFPELSHLDPDNVTIRDSSSDILATLQNRCPNLSSIRTTLSTTDYMERFFAYDLKEAIAALKMVNHRFRAILSSSRQEIFVQVFEKGPSDDIEMEDGDDIEELIEMRDYIRQEWEGRDYIRQETKALGWEICTFIRQKWSFSEGESDDEYGSWDDGDDGDDNFDFFDHLLTINDDLVLNNYFPNTSSALP